MKETHSQILRDVLTHAEILTESEGDRARLYLMAALSVAAIALESDGLNDKTRQYLWVSLDSLEEVCGDDRAVVSTRWALLATLAFDRGDEERFDTCMRLATLGPEAVQRAEEGDQNHE